VWEKTDSPASSKILLPGSWNQEAKGSAVYDGEGPFPIQTGDRSELD